jgi:hypothetical protein
VKSSPGIVDAPGGETLSNNGVSLIKYEILIVCPREMTLTEVYPTPTGSIEHENSDAHKELSERAVPSHDALASQAPRIVTDAGNSVALKLGGSVSVTAEVDT